MPNQVLSSSIVTRDHVDELDSNHTKRSKTVMTEEGTKSKANQGEDQNVEISEVEHIEDSGFVTTAKILL